MRNICIVLKTGSVSGLGRAKRAGVRRFEHMKLAGTAPKNLRVFSDFGLLRGFAAVAASARASERPAAASIATRDHRQPENVNIEKVGPTFSICSEL